MKIKSILMLFLALTSLALVPPSESKIYVIIPDAIINSIVEDGSFHSPKPLVKANNHSLIAIKESELGDLSHYIHETYGRCGGFFTVDSYEDGLKFIQLPSQFAEQEQDYLIQHDVLVNPALQKIEEISIRNVITQLSSFQNRYYRSPTGIASQEKVASYWKELTAGREDATVEMFEHSSYPQKSVILTLKGSTYPNEVVVLGGHGDSIAGWNPPLNALAPGADDNASGIASISEVIRVIAKEGLRFDRTVKFISYAAEEVGLRGSQDIAKKFREQNINVVGVMQLDMTNYRGSAYDVVFMTDYTSTALTKFLQDLVTRYLPQVAWTTDRCGYACSDHASWNKYSYPSAIPFESKMDEYNHYIHTDKDTLAVSNSTALHSVNFAKLALAFTIELGVH